MAIKMAMVCETSEGADALSKELVASGVNSRDISVTGREEKAAGNGYLIDTVEELKSDGQTIGGQTGYLVGAGVALMQGSEAITNSNGVPGLFNSNVAAGITANFVDFGFPRQDHAWARSKIEAGKYLVLAKIREELVETVGQTARQRADELRIFS